MESSIIPTLTECRSSWSAFFAKHNLPDTAIAFSDGTPIFAWCLHHEVLVEPLFEPIENRISYILSDKLEDQHELRFLNLRPVSRENTETVAVAVDEYEKAGVAAWAEYEKALAAAEAEYEKAVDPAWDEYEKATAGALAEYEKAKADAECEKAYAAALAEYEKAYAAARAEYKKAVVPAGDEFEKAKAASRAALSETLAPLHLADVPNHTWNGRSIFA